MADNFFDARVVTVVHDRSGSQTWTASCPAIEGASVRARNFGSARTKSDALIAALLRPEADDLVIVEHRVPQLARAVDPLRWFREEQLRVDKAIEARDLAMVRAVTELERAGVGYRDIGMLLGFSHQRASDLLEFIEETAEEVSDREMAAECFSDMKDAYYPELPDPSFPDTVAMSLLEGDGAMNEDGEVLTIDYAAPLDPNVPTELRPRRKPDDARFQDAPADREARLAWAEAHRRQWQRRQLGYMAGSEVEFILRTEAPGPKTRRNGRLLANQAKESSRE